MDNFDRHIVLIRTSRMLNQGPPCSQIIIRRKAHFPASIMIMAAVSGASVIGAGQGNSLNPIPYKSIMIT